MRLERDLNKMESQINHIRDTRERIEIKHLKFSDIAQREFNKIMPINKRAIISGALGATASSIGKLALSPESPVPTTFHSYCHIILNRYDFHNHEDEHDIIGWICPYVSLGTRVVCFLCMIGVNLLMVSSFLDGMNESGSVVGTALSTAANFSFSVSCLLLGWKVYLVACFMIPSF